MCPYYDEKYQYCNIYGKGQDQKSRESSCLTSSWRDCYYYKKSSFDERVSKKIRSNPDL